MKYSRDTAKQNLRSNPYAYTDMEPDTNMEPEQNPNPKPTTPPSPDRS